MGCFMVGNFFKECDITDRHNKTPQTTFVDIIMIFLTLAIGASMSARTFCSSGRTASSSWASSPLPVRRRRG